MVRYIFIGLLLIAATVFGLSIYLQPDDLTKCNERPSNVGICKSVDAIVAISGGDTDARTLEAIKLYKNGWAEKLVFSGAAQDKSGPSNAAAMKTLAIKKGVSAAAIYIDEYANTTKENAENSQNIFKKHDIKKVILVTSGYHQRRASLEFMKRTGSTEILNHYVKSDNSWSMWWWLTPRGWWLALSEIAKISVFYVTGIWS